MIKLGLIFIVLMMSLASFSATTPEGVQCSDGLMEKLMGSEFPQEFLNQSCFDERKQAGKGNLLIDTDYVDQDTKVCTCLDSNPLNSQLLDHVAHPDDRYFYHLTSTLEMSIQEQQERFNNTIDGLTVQAWLITGDEQKTSLYIQQAESPQEQAELDKKLSKTRAHVKKIYSGAIKGREASPEKTEEALASVSALADKIQGPKRKENPYPSTDVEPPACFSMQTFLGFQQLPQDKEFSQFLKTHSTFSPEQWDLQELKSEYDKAYRKYVDAVRGKSKEQDSLKKQVESVRARMVFLKKNPLFANLFSARLEGPEGKKLREHKEALFNIIQNNFQKDGALNLKAYQDSIRDLFIRPDVLEATRENAQQTLLNEYENDRPLFETKIPRSQQAMERRMAGMQRPVDQCYGKRRDLNFAICVSHYVSYCSVLWPKMGEGQDEAGFMGPSETLSSEMVFDFNINPKENPAFQRLSEQICQADRPSRKDPKKKSNFQGFQKTFCAIETNKETCQKPNGVLYAFLKEYSAPDDSIANSLASFIQNRGEEKKMTTQAAIAARDNAISNTELKKMGAAAYYKKFKGEIAELGRAFEEARKGTPTVVDKQPLKSISSEKTSESLTPNTSSPIGALPSGALASTAAFTPVSKTAAYNEERASRMEEIAEVKKELKEAKSAGNASLDRELQNRLKDLENKLAKRDKEEKFEDKGDSTKSKETDDKISKDGKKSKKAPTPVETGRGPASVGSGTTVTGHKAPTTAPASNWAPVSGSNFGMAKIKTPDGLINNALLAKYGIKLENSAADIFVGSEKEPKDLKKLHQDQNGPALSVEVQDAQYEKFKSHDLTALRSIYESQVRNMKSSIVKLEIKTQGKDSLEFYAIHDGDDVIFQPVRKHELKNLKMILPES